MAGERIFFSGSSLVKRLTGKFRGPVFGGNVAAQERLALRGKTGIRRRASFDVHQPLLQGYGHGMRPGRCVEFLHDIADVELDRSFADSEDHGDVPGALSLPEPLEDLGFFRGEGRSVFRRVSRAAQRLVEVGNDEAEDLLGAAAAVQALIAEKAAFRAFEISHTMTVTASCADFMKSIVFREGKDSMNILREGLLLERIGPVLQPKALEVLPHDGV